MMITAESSQPVPANQKTISTGMVFVSLENWDDVWRRNQFLVSRLVKRGFGPIVYVVPQRDLSNAIRRREWHRFKHQAVFSPQESVYVVQPTKVFPNIFSLARSFYFWCHQRLVRKFTTELNLHKPYLWINDHSASHLVGSFDHGPVLYDITDDWTASSQSVKTLDLIRAQDSRLCEVADAIIVCSDRLLELKTPKVLDRRKLHLVPNGVEYEHYAKSVTPVAATNEWEHPVFMYTGTVHPDRLDVELTKTIANDMTRGSLVFIGPNHLSTQLKAYLLQSHRIRFVDAVPYNDLPAWMAAADAYIVPHRVTPFTESLNPLKLWEYLASGKPIISTSVAGFRDFREHIHIADDPSSFTECMRLAMSEDRNKSVNRRRIASEHSWDNRAHDIEKILRCL